MLSIFRCYWIPDLIYDIFQIIILSFVLLEIMLRVPLKKMLNFSLLFSTCVLISGFYNYFTVKNYGFGELRQAIAFSVGIYELYMIAELYRQYKKTDKFIECLFWVTLSFSVITIISALSLGKIGNSNVNVYPFGNKFSSSYILIQMCCLYYSRRKKSSLIYYILLVATIWFTIFIGCSTATVASIIILVIGLMPEKIKMILINPKTILLSLIFSGFTAFIMDFILNIDFVNELVFSKFDKSITVTGRLMIYSEYIFNLIGEKPLLGYGYYNYAMSTISNGIFANAQNGLLQIILENGFFGAASICYMTCVATSKNKNRFSLDNFSMYLLLYFMVIAGVFEITINWSFFLALACINLTNNSRLPLEVLKDAKSNQSKRHLSCI